MSNTFTIRAKKKKQREEKIIDIALYSSGSEAVLTLSNDGHSMSIPVDIDTVSDPDALDTFISNATHLFQELDKR